MILREQRENYLPLRVIKDRIDSGELDAQSDATSIRVADDRGAADRADDVAGAAEADDDRGRADLRHRATDARTCRRRRADPGPAGRRAAPATTAPPACRPTRAAGRATPQTTEPPASDRSAAARLLPGVLVNRDELCAMVGDHREPSWPSSRSTASSPRRRLGDDLYDDDAVEIAAVAVEFLRPASTPATSAAGARRPTGRPASTSSSSCRCSGSATRRPASTHATSCDELNELGGKLRAAMMRAALRPTSTADPADRPTRSAALRVEAARYARNRGADGARRRPGRGPRQHADGAPARAERSPAAAADLHRHVEATAIHYALEGVEPPRPLTHDLFVQTMTELGVTLEQVVVTEMRDHTYYAELHLRSAEQGLTVMSSRPSDAIALAVRCERLDLRRRRPARRGRPGTGGRARGRGGGDHRRVPRLHRAREPGGLRRLTGSRS